MNQNLSTSQLANDWDIPWSIMDVLIGGKSSIDLSHLYVNSRKEADSFLKSYGYDIQRKDDQRFLHGVIIESLNFIERNLMPKEWKAGKKPPKEIRLCNDPCDLVQWASNLNPDFRYHRAWACAVLRVGHTICHLESTNQATPFDDARAQIMGRFEEFLYRDPPGENLWLGSKNERIELDKVEWKIEKSRESLILKLLHKPGNVAETIYDLFGIRIVTKRLCDVMMAVKFLRQFHMITFANCHPQRARNSLIDVERFRGHLDSLRQLLSNQAITTEDFNLMLDKLTLPLSKTRSSNPHSSGNYKSIQLTCRQLIRSKNPAFTWTEKLKKVLEEPGLNDKRKQILRNLLLTVDSWESTDNQKESAAFYPFEVQIMDKESYDHNTHGAAAHDRYKKLQVRTARRRVLSEVLARN